jgi:rfaE bifunctional protein nucleotidyltransferase chain/domain
MTISKLMSLDDAIAQCEQWRRDGSTIVFTNGCFDLLHPGHLSYLNDAKSLGARLVIGLNSDDSIRRLKGLKRPIMSETDRATMVSGLSSVDMVVMFKEDTPIDLISSLKPDIHVKGGDYVAEHLPEYAIVTAYGGQVKILPFIYGHSTSGIIETILKRYC